jgi:hypothetical protein
LCKYLLNVGLLVLSQLLRVKSISEVICLLNR